LKNTQKALHRQSKRRRRIQAEVHRKLLPGRSRSRNSSVVNSKSDDSNGTTIKKWDLTGVEGIYRLRGDGGQYDISHVKVYKKSTRVKQWHLFPESERQCAFRHSFGVKRNHSILLRLRWQASNWLTETLNFITKVCLSNLILVQQFEWSALFTLTVL
jgi:hypothetical protein